MGDGSHRAGPAPSESLTQRLAKRHRVRRGEGMGRKDRGYRIADWKSDTGNKIEERGRIGNPCVGLRLEIRGKGCRGGRTPPKSGANRVRDSSQRAGPGPTGSLKQRLAETSCEAWKTAALKNRSTGERGCRWTIEIRGFGEGPLGSPRSPPGSCNPQRSHSRRCKQRQTESLTQRLDKRHRVRR